MLTERGSVLPNRRSVRCGAARLRSTSESRFDPIVVPEVIAVVVQEVAQRVSLAIARNAPLLHSQGSQGARGDCNEGLIPYSYEC